MKILTYINSTLRLLGCRDILQHISEKCLIENVKSINDLFDALNKDTCLILLEYDNLPEPKDHILHKLYTKNSKTPVVALTNSVISEKSLIYIKDVVKDTDDESDILKKLKKYANISRDKPFRNNLENELSEREKQVLRLVAFGYTNKEISNELNISTHTVITHRKNITAKLSIKTIAGLTVYAVLNGIVTSEELKM